MGSSIGSSQAPTDPAVLGPLSADADKLCQQLLLELDFLSAPFTCEERYLRDEIEQLSGWVAERLPIARLSALGMKPQECHENCARYHFYSDPHSKIVSGWWVQDDMYVHHSVILAGSRLICVTPHEDNDRALNFIPDAKIKLNPSSEGRIFPTREGRKISFGVRRNPDQVIARAERMKQQLLSGMNPYEVIQSDKFPGC